MSAAWMSLSSKPAAIKAPAAVWRVCNVTVLTLCTGPGARKPKVGSYGRIFSALAVGPSTAGTALDAAPVAAAPAWPTVSPPVSPRVALRAAPADERAVERAVVGFCTAVVAADDEAASSRG